MSAASSTVQVETSRPASCTAAAPASLNRPNHGFQYSAPSSASRASGGSSPSVQVSPRRASPESERSSRSAGHVARHEERALQRVGRQHLLERARHDLAPGEVDHQRDRHRLEHLAQGRDAHVTVPDPGHLGPVQVAHRRVDAPQAFEGLVVQHHDLAVAGAPQVDLDPVRPQAERRREGAQRVLAVPDGLAPVGDGDRTCHRSRPRPLRVAGVDRARPRWR